MSEVETLRWTLAKHETRPTLSASQPAKESRGQGYHLVPPQTSLLWARGLSLLGKEYVQRDRNVKLEEGAGAASALGILFFLLSCLVQP